MSHSIQKAVVIFCFFTFATLTSHPAPAAAPQTAPTVSGTVAETMNAGGYTYLLVKTAQDENWVAIPETTVAVGDAVTYYEGMVMNNFNSKTLNRTFPSVIFSSGLIQAGAAAPATTQAQNTSDDSFAAAVKAEQQTVQPDTANPHGGMNVEISGGSAGAIAPQQDVDIPKAAGDNSYRVGDIFKEAEQLDGKTVRVHGKVVKISLNIMGKNWIHLQDGTGDSMQNTHDLVFTSQAVVETGSIVTLEGILAANKDFGAGYKYSAIVEDATLIPE